MIQLTGFDWFLGAIYHSSIRASLLSDITAIVREELSAGAYSPLSVESALKRIGTVGGVTSDQQHAFARLTHEDLLTIQFHSQQPEVIAAIDARSDFVAVLTRTAELATSAARELGLPVEEVPSIYFVDEFPSPYGRSAAAVLAADEGDHREFGMEPGLYIRSGARPFYTEFIICHEIIHIVLGAISPDMFSSRLEEGIAEVLGAGLIGIELLGLPMVLRLFVLNRLSRSQSAVWERYLEATRQAWHIVQVSGLEELIRIVSGGRSAVAKIEDQLLAGSYPPVISGGKERAANDLSILMDRVCLTYPRSLIASPGAVLLAPYLDAGSTIREAAASAHLEPGFALECARELQDELGLLALRPDDAVVTFSEAARVARSGLLRYSRPADA